MNQVFAKNWKDDPKYRYQFQNSLLRNVSNLDTKPILSTSLTFIGFWDLFLTINIRLSSFMYSQYVRKPDYISFFKPINLKPFQKDQTV